MIRLPKRNARGAHMDVATDTASESEDGSHQIWDASLDVGLGNC